MQCKALSNRKEKSMKQRIRIHAEKHLSHLGIIQIKNGHIEAHGVYGATVILTRPETIEYYHA